MALNSESASQSTGSVPTTYTINPVFIDLTSFHHFFQPRRRCLYTNKQKKPFNLITKD
jgi:hypothetical protein